MYNVRVIKYPCGGHQLRFYNYLSGMDNTPLSLLDSKTRIQRLDASELEYVPFTESYEKVRTETEIERSFRSSLNRTINKIYYLSRSNLWNWFITLTFAPEHVNSFDYSECTKKLSVWLNNCKRNCPTIKYLIVPEKHKSGRYHFHGLLADADGLEFVDSGKTDNKGQTIYNIGKYRLGYTTATMVANTEKVSKYITKYISKELCSVTSGKRRYWCSRNLSQAEIVDYFLDLQEKDTLMSQIVDDIQYSTIVKSGDNKIQYIELRKGVEL